MPPPLSSSDPSRPWAAAGGAVQEAVSLQLEVLAEGALVRLAGRAVPQERLERQTLEVGVEQDHLAQVWVTQAAPVSSS